MGSAKLIKILHSEGGSANIPKMYYVIYDQSLLEGGKKEKIRDGLAPSALQPSSLVHVATLKEDQEDVYKIEIGRKPLEISEEERNPT